MTNSIYHSIPIQRILLFLSVFLLHPAYAQKSNLPVEDDLIWYKSEDISSWLKLEMPAVKPGERIIPHSAYSLVYNEAHEQAA